MEKIKEVNHIAPFGTWGGKARNQIVQKFNELIKVINQQQEEIQKLKQNVPVIQLEEILPSKE